MRKIILKKVKKGKIGILKNWVRELKKNKSEVLITLKEENVFNENLSIIRIDNQEYAIFVIDYHKRILQSNKNRVINRKHTKVLKECLEKENIESKNLYNFSIT